MPTFFGRATFRPSTQRGAVAFVEWLIGSRLTVVVATSAKQEEVEGVADDLRRAGPDDERDDIGQRRSIQTGSRYPRAALQKCGSSAGPAIMIGDTRPMTLKAANRAGLAAIAFRCGGWEDAQLHGSVAIYDDPEELLSRLPQSPFYAEVSQAGRAFAIASIVGR